MMWDQKNEKEKEPKFSTAYNYISTETGTAAARKAADFVLRYRTKTLQNNPQKPLTKEKLSDIIGDTACNGRRYATKQFSAPEAASP